MTKYEGEITSIIQYLESERPVGWLEEISKLQDLTGSFVKPGVTNWPIKFRQISPEVVLSVKHNNFLRNIFSEKYLFPDISFHGPKNTEWCKEERIFSHKDFEIRDGQQDEEL